ncbi:MAG: helix-turn-helix domain-containing protein [Candidatus Baltobacteraceae bacterium]|jgi:DNA-binding HxlR family transcriptional regulator
MHADVTHFLNALRALGRHRNCAILRTLADGPRRFNDIVAAMPSIPELSLSAALRELDAEGLLSRHVVPGPPLRVMYQLTPDGLRLVPAALSLGELEERSAS